MPAAPSEYEKAHLKYRELANAARAGDKQAHQDKAKVMNEIRAIERQSARDGRVLSAIPKGPNGITVDVRETSSKRSLQEEYVRKFDAEKTVNVGGKEQTLQEYHANRLLRR